MKTFCSKEKYDQIVKGMAKKIGFMVLGGIIGAVIASATGVGDAMEYVLYVLVCACIPYAWSKIPIHVYGFSAAAVTCFIVKLIVAFLLGLIITPITFIYDLVRVIVYKVQEKKIANANQTVIK